VGWTWGSGIAERHGAVMQWDSVAGVPYAYFSNGGVYEWLFLENARSFREKLNLTKSYRLRGFSVWVLGPEDSAIWDILKAEPGR
jgi:spore germination protein YaaH